MTPISAKFNNAQWINKVTVGLKEEERGRMGERVQGVMGERGLKEVKEQCLGYIRKILKEYTKDVN